MTTLSPTKARANLSSWLKKAAAGEQVAILYGDQIIALKPVQVEEVDYAEKEYGITHSEMRQIEAQLSIISKEEMRTKKSKVFKGSLEDLV